MSSADDAAGPMPHPSDIIDLDRAPQTPDLTIDDNGVSYLIVSAGGSAVKTLRRLRHELNRGRRVSVVATPTAAAWFEHYGVVSTIEELSGFPLRWRMPVPSTPTFSPPGSRLVVSPCSLNTLTKWAAAHCDNLALSLLCEAVGRGVPVQAEVSLSPAYLAHPAATEALERLSAMGVGLFQAIGGGPHRLLAALPEPVTAALAAD